MAEDSQLEVRCERREDAVVVLVRGEVDLGTVPILRAALQGPDARGNPVVLDLRQLAFIDSSGLSLVVGEHQRASVEGFRFAVAVGGAPAVERLFELAGLSETLTLVDDPETALKS